METSFTHHLKLLFNGIVVAVLLLAPRTTLAQNIDWATYEPVKDAVLNGANEANYDKAEYYIVLRFEPGEPDEKNPWQLTISKPKNQPGFDVTSRVVLGKEPLHVQSISFPANSAQMR